MNPMSAMMGMMGGAMGMPPMGMPPMGMPPMGMPPMGMPPMGMPPMGMPGLPPPGGVPASDAQDSRKKQRTREKDDHAAENSNSESSSCQSQPRSRSKRHQPERIEEVEKFLDENGINEEASTKVRAMSPTSQRRVIARPLTGDVQNPSKVMIARVRELQSQHEKMKGNDMWSAWGSAMMGASQEAINKYIEDNDLDESASRQLRSLPPHQQVMALKWDLSKYRNPSAKFMSMANGFSTMGPRMMMPMFGMGMPPMMPMGMWPMSMPPPGMPAMDRPPHGMPGPSGMPGPPSTPDANGIPTSQGLPGPAGHRQ